MFDIAYVESKLKYTFKNKQLLKQAFVHSSYAKVKNVSDNERMEFFGDAILDFIVSEYILDRYPDFDAGKLSTVRATVVSAQGLRPIVDKLGILDCLMAANGSNIRALSKKIEANLYEAVLCAIYMDGGMSAAKRFVLRTLKADMDAASQHLKRDYKTIVQEYCQERKLTVEYKEENRAGPDNKPTFCYSLWIDGKKVSSGSGSSIKNAEQEAACQIVKDWRLD